MAEIRTMAEMTIYSSNRANDAHNAAALVLAIALVTIGAAWAFEILGGYKPCPLCLQERWPYYIAIPACAIAMVLLNAGRGGSGRALLGLTAFAFVAGAVMGGYHSGVEWRWWPGPTDCSGSGSLDFGGNLSAELSKTRVVRCDEAPWRFLGISFAGFNFLISAGLGAVAAYGALRKPDEAE